MGEGAVSEGDRLTASLCERNEPRRLDLPMHPLASKRRICMARTKRWGVNSALQHGRPPRLEKPNFLPSQGVSFRKF